MQPVLRAPPFANAPCISRTIEDWEIVAPVAAGFDPLDDPVAASIIAGRVGGKFWAPPPALQSRPAVFPAGELSGIILPDNAAIAFQFCERVLEGVAARQLVAVLPHMRGTFTRLAETLKLQGCTIMQPGDPHALLSGIASVHVMQICDEAVLGLLAGHRVFRWSTQGMQRQAPSRALLWVQQATRYTNPFSGAPAGCTEIIEILTDWRRMLERNRQVAVLAGMTFWKRRRLSQLFASAAEPVPYRRSVNGMIAAARKRQGGIAIWSRVIPPGLEEKARQAGVKLLRVEDGFIRSQGLGCEFLPPSSVVADSRAHYFDPSCATDLEHLLATTSFSAKLQKRARRLIDMLVNGAVSKYGAGGAAPVLQAKPGQRILLVPAQVADDLSVRLGGGGIQGNHDLLSRVRAGNPEAFIIYRPHPDVDAGHRPGAIPDPTALTLADTICRGAIAPLLGTVDEVHTVTSLTGFEALLRGRVVKTYGQPFYAGWGLTDDNVPVARRQRRLSIEELAAGVLILYPYYVDPATGLPCGPELLVARLQEPELWRPSLLTRARRLQGSLRRRFPAMAHS